MRRARRRRAPGDRGVAARQDREARADRSELPGRLRPRCLAFPPRRMGGRRLVVPPLAHRAPARALVAPRAGSPEGGARARACVVTAATMRALLVDDDRELARLLD